MVKVLRHGRIIVLRADGLCWHAVHDVVSAKQTINHTMHLLSAFKQTPQESRMKNVTECMLRDFGGNQLLTSVATASFPS